MIQCPYCGSSNVEYVGTPNDYHCKDCDWLFEENDIERESIRHQVSLLLDGTDIDRPLDCDIIVGEDEACGLSSLELPNIVKCHQIPGDGTMWFHIEGEIDTDGQPAWHDFDWFSMSDIRAIRDGLLNR